MQCSKQARRSLLPTGLATGAFLAAGRPAAAQEDQPGGESDRKKATCWFSRKGTMRGEVNKPSDLTGGGPPIHAWPKDGKTSVIRKGLNEIGR
jgi:rieske iron-sulfur protein